jgi:hypothetical protein
MDLASPKLCLPFLGLTYDVMLRGYARQAQQGAYYLSVYYVATCFVYIFGMLFVVFVMKLIVFYSFAIHLDIDIVKIMYPKNC